MSKKPDDETARWERRAHRAVHRYNARGLKGHYHLAVFEEWWVSPKAQLTRIDDQLDVLLLLEELHP